MILEIFKLFSKKSKLLSKEKLCKINDIFIKTSLSLRLHSILEKPPNSTNFNKLQVLVTTTFGSTTQAIHQACFNLVIFVLSCRC